MEKKPDFNILDCSLRDGGYYTNWDFAPAFVENYLECMNSLSLDYVEIGYRSKPKEGYLGAYFYCPDYILENARKISNKKLAIILNEKDVEPSDIENLLKPCIGIISLIRIAVAPHRLSPVLQLVEEIKKLNFEVSLNIMYLSIWTMDTSFMSALEACGEAVDYLYLVDSYGGMYPDQVEEITAKVASRVNCRLGFHAHNNLELALANSLAAAEAGATIIDGTITGMGRGAGNLKTELLLTSLDSQEKIDLDYDKLSRVVDQFSGLQKEYNWGTNLAYMVSGANSLPQQEVMAQLNKRYYSLGSIVRGVSNKSKGRKDNLELKEFNPAEAFDFAVIVGGGPTGTFMAEAVKKFLEKNGSGCLIHASSKNAAAYKGIAQPQYHCLEGNEGHRLERVYQNLNDSQKIAILPPYPRSMGTYIPAALEDNAYQLHSIKFTDQFTESVTALSIETALKLQVSQLYFVGYDGYEGKVSSSEMELFMENEYLFAKISESPSMVSALTPTKYSNLKQKSIFSLL